MVVNGFVEVDAGLFCCVVWDDVPGFFSVKSDAWVFLLGDGDLVPSGSGGIPFPVVNGEGNPEAILAGYAGIDSQLGTTL